MTDITSLPVAQQRAAVAQEALSWHGTAYHHHARIKGVGVDCAQILIAIYAGLGLAPEVDPGQYAHDWHLHQGEEVYIGWIESAGGREVQVPQLGDIGLFRFGRTYSHSAICVGDGMLVHAALGSGVIVSGLDEAPLAGRLVRWFTIFKD